MSANVGSGLGGQGGKQPVAIGGEGVNTPEPLLSDEDMAQIDGLSVKEAIEKVAPDGAAVNMPSVDEVTFPGPVSERFYWSNDSVAGIQGPVGSGKTTTLLKSRIRRAIQMPKSVIDGVRRYKLTISRETYRQLWSTTIPSYLETYPRDMGVWSGGRGDPVTHKILFEDDYGPIEFVAEFMAFGDDIDAAMRGLQTTDFWLNEADTMPVDVITTGIGRINRWPAREHFAGLHDSLRSYGQIVCDFNAPDGDENWAVNVFHDKEKRLAVSKELSKNLPEGANAVTIEFFNQPGFGEDGCENLQNLAPGYYESQIALNRLAGRGDKNERLVYNRVANIRVGQPVFEREFSRQMHVATSTMDLVPGYPLLIGLDQGFKAAAILAQHIDGRYWRIYAELHFPKEHLMARVFGSRLAELMGTPRFSQYRCGGAWGDMAGEQGASQGEDENASWNLLASQAAGIKIKPQRIAANRIQPRLEALRAPMEFVEAGQPGLLIDPCCKMLIRGFEARYVWTEEVNASGDKRKIPDKSHTEANVVDAAQYLLLSKHRGDGTSPLKKSTTTIGQSDDIGHNGGPPLQGGGGLITEYNPLDPYGE